MKLSEHAQKLLIDVPKPSNWVPDEYDVGLRDIMVDWREADSADIGIIGVPFDTAVMGRRGCRFGPESVRSSLVFSNVYDPSVDVDLSTGLSVTDFGNIDVLQTNVLGTHERIETVISEIYALDTTPVIIGGDHSITYANVKSLINNTAGNVGVIMIATWTYAIPITGKFPAARLSGVSWRSPRDRFYQKTWSKLVSTDGSTHVITWTTVVRWGSR